MSDGSTEMEESLRSLAKELGRLTDPLERIAAENVDTFQDGTIILWREEGKFVASPVEDVVYPAQRLEPADLDARIASLGSQMQIKGGESLEETGRFAKARGIPVSYGESDVTSSAMGALLSSIHGAQYWDLLERIQSHYKKLRNVSPVTLALLDLKALLAADESLKLRLHRPSAELNQALGEEVYRFRGPFSVSDTEVARFSLRPDAYPSSKDTTFYDFELGFTPDTRHLTDLAEKFADGSWDRYAREAKGLVKKQAKKFWNQSGVNTEEMKFEPESRSIPEKLRQELILEWTGLLARYGLVSVFPNPPQISASIHYQPRVDVLVPP